MELVITQQTGPIAVVALHGTLDLLAAQEVKQRFIDLVGQGCPQVVVDMEAVTFLDSSGLSALISGLKAARLAGGDLRLARLGKQALHILKVSSLDRVLRPHPTVEDALAAFRV